MFLWVCRSQLHHQLCHGLVEEAEQYVKDERSLGVLAKRFSPYTQQLIGHN